MVHHKETTIYDDSDDRDSDSHTEADPPVTKPSGTLRVLARGNACLCCRRRKLKCDGTKPHCTPCTRGRRTSECIYEEVKVKTKTQILQSRIRELEAKVRRMEKSASSSPVASSKTSFSSPGSRRKQSSTTTLTSSPTATPETSTHQHDEPALFPTPAFVPLDQSELLGPTYSFSTSFEQTGVPQPWLTSGDSTISTEPESFPSLPMLSLSAPDSWLSAETQSSLTWITQAHSSRGGSPSISEPMREKSTSTSSLNIVAPLATTSSVSPSFSAATLCHSTSVSSASTPPSLCWEDENIKQVSFDLLHASDNEDIPETLRNELLQIFFQHSHQCMFEVHIERFMASLDLPAPHCPHPALMNAIFLLACHFSPPLSSSYESMFLARTRRYINQSLESSDRLINFLQASMLLAWYFFFKGRYLEGQHHASSAARFAMASSLHLLKVKVDNAMGTLTFFTPGDSFEKSLLGPPKDFIDLAERINLFWSIFIADRTSSIATGLPVVIPDDEVETPFPRRFEDYKLGDSVKLDTDLTLRSIYERGNPGAFVAPSDTLHAIKAKALSLNERAFRLSVLLESNPGLANDPTFWPSYDCVDQALSQFQRSLPSPSVIDASYSPHWRCESEESYDVRGCRSTISPSLAMAHTATNVAIINMTRMFSQSDPASYTRCISAARTAVAILKEISAIKADYLPMLFGIMWPCVAEAMAVEHERFRRADNHSQVKAIEEELKILLTAMRQIRAIYPILTLRINKVPMFQGAPNLLDISS
ncbi:hypothetical protein FRC03_008893 [Tulasnella sp. 419]|nr:hypothetical protein FRC03_008893 [Tulasnella sp. 419]